MRDIDEAILRLLNGLARDHELVAHLGQLFSHLAFGLTALTLFTYLAQRHLKKGWQAALLVVVAIAIVDRVGDGVLKPLIGRLRPCHALTALVTPDGCGGQYGMPSLHAANAYTVAFLVTMLRPILSFPIYLVATLIALSRPVLGVHYPTDLLGGLVWGTVVGVGLWLPVRRRFRSAIAAKDWKATTATRLAKMGR